jgi:hypothetical protein
LREKGGCLDIGLRRFGKSVNRIFQVTDGVSYRIVGIQYQQIRRIVAKQENLPLGVFYGRCGWKVGQAFIRKQA